MAFSNARARYYSSSDDSDAYENLISRLKSSQSKSSTTSKSSNESLNKFIANDSSDISNESGTSDDEENGSDDLGLHLRLNNKFGQMSFNERTPLKCLIQNSNKPSGSDADPIQGFNKTTNQTVTPKKNDKITSAKTTVKPVSKGRVYSTRIVFSSSDEEVFVPTKLNTFDDKLPAPITSSVKVKAVTEKENVPVIELSSDESDFEIFSTTPGFIRKLPSHPKPTFTSASKENTNQNFLNDSDSYRPLVNRIKGTVDGKRGNSLGEGFATPVNTRPKPAPMTEVVHKVTSRLKPRDGLPENLPSKCSIGKHFKTHREEVTKILFEYFNETVFENKLPADMEVVWSKRLLKTAGTTRNKRRTETKLIAGKKVVETSYSSAISLSEKVLDNLPRLRDTLIHEMCHAAVWVISNVNEGHGPYWKWWAQKAMKQFPDLPVIKRCHSYDITYKFYYQCTLCKQTIGRQSKSINTEKSCCGVCKGKLVLLPSKNGDGTPRTPNKFALFVKENYNSYKEKETRNGCETPKHGEIMKGLSKEFSKLKTS